MTPLKLTLKGFIGIRDGLNRNELTLDLEPLIDGASLIALIGENGTGKTTVLDNLHPYRVMPFRAGGYTPSSFSYYDHMYGKEASKELLWEHQSLRYRSTLLFKHTGKTKKSECYLQVKIDGQWQPAVTEDGISSDGKTDTYDRSVESVLGSPELFFTTAFSAQSKKSLSEYGNKEIKDLLSELLGHDRVLALGDKAQKVTSALTTHHGLFRQSLSDIENFERTRNQTTENRDSCQGELEAKAEEKKTAKNQLRTATKDLADKQAAINSALDVEVSRHRLTEQLTSANAQKTSQLAAIQQDIENDQRQLSESEARLMSELNHIDQQVKVITTRQQNQHGLINQKDDIAQAIEQLPTLTEQERSLNQALTKARQQSKAHQAKNLELVQLKERLSTLSSEGKLAATQLEGLQKRSALIEQVPCAGTELQPKCSLLRDAVQARDNIGAAQADVEEKRNQYQTLKNDYDSRIEHLESMADPEIEITRIDRQVTEVREKIQQAQKFAALKDALQQASDILTDCEKELARLNERREQLVSENESSKQAINVRITDRHQQAEQTQLQSDRVIDRIRSELDQLPPPLSQEDITEAEQAVSTADNVLAQVDRDIESLQQRLAEANSAIKACDHNLKQLGQVRQDAERIETEISYWSLLSKALSRDGVIALAIDDAGPTLAALTNDLLTTCYGPRYSVRIDTLKEAQNGNLREIFDIKVFDAEQNSEKSLRMTSGGERIWINEALTRAIALYQAQSTGTASSSIFADESDGALDTARKKQFMTMKRRVLELGNYDHEFFISHTPELWALADTVIDLSAYKLQ